MPHPRRSCPRGRALVRPRPEEVHQCHFRPRPFSGAHPTRRPGSDGAGASNDERRNRRRRAVVRALGRVTAGPTIYARARSPTPFSTSHLTIISLSWGNYRCVSNRDNSAQSGESEPRPITGLAPPRPARLDAVGPYARTGLPVASRRAQKSSGQHSLTSEGVNRRQALVSSCSRLSFEL